MNSSSLFGFENIITNSGSSNIILFELLLMIRIQVQFSTVFVLSNSNTNTLTQYGTESYLMDYLGVPVIQLTTSKSYQLKQHFRDDILAIVYLTAISYQDVLNMLVDDLHRMAQTKIVFVCPGMKNIMMKLFKMCWSKKMINAIAFLEDTYFSYNPFPQMQLKEHSIEENREVFPNRLLNVHRHPFRMLIDGVEPRDYVYVNRKGQVNIGGYTAHFLSSFADKINATLTTPIDSGTEILYHQDTDKLLATDVIDIFGGLVILLPPMRGQSDPAEVIGLCLMIPVEPKVPQYLYYPMIFKSYPILMMFSMIIVFSLLVWCIFQVDGRTKLHLSEMILNEKCTRALLGQPFVEYPRSSMKLRAIYFLSCALGLFFSSIYLATLNTLVTSPTSEALITTFEDLRHAPFKVFLYRPEYNEVLNMTDEFEKYSDTFEFTFNHTLFHLKRNTMDTRYAFSVPTNKWKTFEEQQSLFTVPLYRNSDLCLIPVLFMVFLLNENSIYLDTLNQMIVRTHQSGLYDHWVRAAFLELVEAKRMRLDVSSEAKTPQPLTLDDMRWLWGLFAALVFIDTIVLAMEIVWYKTSEKRIAVYRYFFL